MTAELRTVLEIAAVGSTLLFAALAGLVALMYLLTAPRPGRRAGRPAPVAAAPGALGDAGDEAERERRRRAAGIAAAVAAAEAGRAAADADASNWRRVHRGRLMGGPATRSAPRSRR